MLILLMATMLLSATPALADFSVYQGNPKAGKLLGIFDTLREARHFARTGHNGLGETIVNNRTGETAKSTGRVFHGNGGQKH